MQSALNTATIPHARWIRIVPPTIIIYIIAYMDKINIGFAMAGGMNEELGLSMAVAGLAAGCFSLAPWYCKRRLAISQNMAVQRSISNTRL